MNCPWNSLIQISNVSVLLVFGNTKNHRPIQKDKRDAYGRGRLSCALWGGAAMHPRSLSACSAVRPCIVYVINVYTRGPFFPPILSPG